MKNGGSRTTVRVAVVVGAVAMLLAACGTRVPEDTAQSGNVGVQGGSGGAAQGPVGTTAGSGAPMFGEMEAPCGPGDTSSYPASDTGVTADSIAITTIADPGGAKPGLNQGVFDSMLAFTEWCNSLGGINGRKVVLNQRDAKLTQYKERVLEACASDFALVGGIGVLDELGAQDAVDCGLVNIPAAAVSPQQTAADRTVQPNPNPPNTYQVGPARWEVQQYPDQVRKAGSVYSKFNVTETQSARLIEGYESVGFDFVYEQSANVNETNYGPIVVGMKDAGVEWMTLTSSFEEIIPLQKEMANQDFSPIVELEQNFYNAKYPEQAGSVADGTLVRLLIWPFEEADQNPATRQYLDLLEQNTPGAQPEMLGVYAFSAGLLWAQAAKNLGPNVTRDGLLDELRKITEWNGGGLHGVTNPGADIPSTCFIMMKVDNGGFTRVYPTPDDPAYEQGGGFDCLPTDEGLAPLSAKDYAAGGAKEKSGG